MRLQMQMQMLASIEDGEAKVAWLVWACWLAGGGGWCCVTVYRASLGPSNRHHSPLKDYCVPT